MAISSSSSSSWSPSLARELPASKLPHHSACCFIGRLAKWPARCYASRGVAPIVRKSRPLSWLKSSQLALYMQTIISSGSLNSNLLVDREFGRGFGWPSCFDLNVAQDEDAQEVLARSSLSSSARLVRMNWREHVTKSAACGAALLKLLLSLLKHRIFNFSRTALAPGDHHICRAFVSRRRGAAGGHKLSAKSESSSWGTRRQLVFGFLSAS